MSDNKAIIITKEIREKISSITIDIKEEIRKFRNEMETAKEDLNKLDAIASDIKELKKVLAPLEGNYNNKIRNLNHILDDVKEIDEALELDTFGQMFRAINNNLPDGIMLEDDEDNKQCKYIVSGRKCLGSIEAIGPEDIDFKVQIEINGYVAENKIANTGKIYTIINFINDKLNYKSDEFTIEKKQEKNSN